MSLFPAYGDDGAAGPGPGAGEAALWAERPGPGPAGETARWAEAENELLASSDSEPEAPRAAPPAPAPELDYYVDRRFDGGNLRVSTIYYPGRPQYNSLETYFGIGLKKPIIGSGKRKRRYWEVPVPEPRGEGGGEGEGERGAALRRALAERPADLELWLQYVDYQEWVFGPGAGAAAAEAAAARLPRSAAVRARRLDARRRELTPQDYVARLRDDIQHEKDPSATAELWARLVAALARAPAAGVRGALAAAAAAARHGARRPQAYPGLLLQCGAVLRAAGLWETLVLLLELSLSVNTPRDVTAAFPPPRDAAAERAADRRLQDYEDKVVSSGLPSGAVWARVERARAAAHWRAEGGPRAELDPQGGPRAELDPRGGPRAELDPQRAPQLADVADLLLPCTDPAATLMLHINALRLAKVPLLPGSQYMSMACGDDADWSSGEALLSAVRAARRLPPAHPSRCDPAAARDVLRLLVDPPHYFGTDAGWSEWVEALWAAALAAAADSGVADAAQALLCWRLRWLHALLLLLPETAESCDEARRILDLAQATLRRWGGALPLPFAAFARLQAAAGARGAAGGGRGARAAELALRAALQDPGAPHHHLLYVARIVHEVSGDAAALARAVLRRPASAGADAGAAPELLREARDECERRCAALEEEMETEDDSTTEDCGAAGGVVRALLPARAEWGAALVLLATPPRRAELTERALALSPGLGRRARWREQQAAALLAHARAPAAAAFSRRYPDNVLFALAAGGAVSGGGGGGGGCAVTPARLLGAAWAPLLRAAAGWEPRAAGLLARRLRRGDEAAAPAWLWALRLEAEARAPGTRLERVAHAAMDALPHHKWLVVRAAALGAAGGGGALPDVLLERGLRLHALPDELRALGDP